MTKTELINTLVKASKLEKRYAKTFLESLTDVVTKEIRKGGEVPLTGLGKFKVSRRKARIGRNPQTGEEIKIPAKRVVKFAVAKALKDQIRMGAVAKPIKKVRRG
jgi:DNA-binding protein HU-beta